MRINVINVSSNQVPGKKYKQIEVSYKNDKGELKGKKLMDFGVKRGLDILLGAKEGTALDVEVVKEGEYWNWKGVDVANGAASTASVTKSGGYSVPARDFETKAERAARQVLIVRQSCLNVATNIITTGAKVAPNVDEVIKMAEKLEHWVFSSDEIPAGLADVSQEIE